MYYLQEMYKQYFIKCILLLCHATSSATANTIMFCFLFVYNETRSIMKTFLFHMWVEL